MFSQTPPFKQACASFKADRGTGRRCPNSTPARVGKSVSAHCSPCDFEVHCMNERPDHIPVVPCCGSGWNKSSQNCFMKNNRAGRGSMHTGRGKHHGTNSHLQPTRKGKSSVRGEPAGGGAQVVTLEVRCRADPLRSLRARDFVISMMRLLMVETRRHLRRSRPPRLPCSLSSALIDGRPPRSIDSGISRRRLGLPRLIK